MSRDITINRIPSLTWNWLKMNQTSAAQVPVGTECDMKLEVPAEVKQDTVAAMDSMNVKTGLGSELFELIAEANVPVHQFTVEADTVVSEPVRAELAYADGQAAVNAMQIHAKAGSQVTVIQYIHADENAAGDAVISTKYEVEANAKVRVIQVQTVGKNFRVFNDLGGHCAEEGRFELVQVILGGKSYYGNYTDLEGVKSSYSSDIGYLVGQDETLDMNYVAFHTGKKTDCAINVAGVLAGNAKKVFRGTIDFQRGAKTATGNELEEVLLMDDDVINQTIPVILCQEEDVEGNHGASIGKLDETLLFYLQSRGMDLEEIYKMMSRAKVEAVNNKIEDEKTRQIVLDYLNRSEA